MGLKDIGETLPAGFRFNPSDDELVCHYLFKKIVNEEVLKGTLVEIDLHTIEPWQLPEVAKLNEEEWYFFSFRDRKYATGLRTNRATTTGYWKATGKDRVILDPKTRQTVGMRKTLVFYLSRAPHGVKTPWIMHEFRLETPHMLPKEDWVLCRVFRKGKGENNNNQISDSFNMNPSSEIQTLRNPISHLPQLLEQGDSTTTYTFVDDMMKDSSKNDSQLDQVDEGDQYGFLWDMGMDGASLGYGAHHGHHQHHRHEFGDMGFEDVNGLVLL